MGVKSNSVKGSRPRSLNIWPARMLGGVPTRVVVPPRMAPKASGMKSREGDSPARGARVATAGISTAVAAMLFMKAESTPATSMSTMIRRISLLPTRRWIWAAMPSATPVSKSAAPRMKTDSMVMTAGDENPWKASAGVT